MYTNQYSKIKTFGRLTSFHKIKSHEKFTKVGFHLTLNPYDDYTNWHTGLFVSL